MTNVILLASLTLLGILITISLFLAGGYLWWHHKRSQLKFIEPNENVNSSTFNLSKKGDSQETRDGGTVVTKPQPQTQAQESLIPLQTSLNIKLNDFLNFKTPLVGSIPSSIKPSGGAVVETFTDPENKLMQINDMYMENTDSSENVGQIHFSVEYDFQNTTFILKILQGKELPAKDLSGTSDPYVRVTLLPDKKHRLETKIKRRTLNPRWNETFYFEGYPIQKLQCRVWA